jgi:predicted MPP superfamily phosphohydrolase
MKKRLHVILLFCGCVAAAFFMGCSVSFHPKTSLAAAEGTPEPTSTQTPAPTATPAPTPFSIVWLSDTQSITYYNYPHAMEDMGRWIAEQRVPENILYVVQTGDMVDNGFVPRQWDIFDECYNQFKDDIPYFAIAGNHDIGVKLQDYSAYLARPNVSSIPRRNSFERGRAVYATFEAGGTKFLLLGAGWESEEMSVDWMNQVLKEHSDSVAILLFHSYILMDGSYTNKGKMLFEKVVKPNPNVRLVLCGHVSVSGARFEELDDNGDGVNDRKVTAMLYNYQDFMENCGQLRLLTFDPVTRSIDVMTYSPFTGRYFWDDYFKTVEFTLEDAF